MTWHVIIITISIYANLFRKMCYMFCGFLIAYFYTSTSHYLTYRFTNMYILPSLRGTLFCDVVLTTEFHPYMIIFISPSSFSNELLFIMSTFTNLSSRLPVVRAYTLISILLIINNSIIFVIIIQP
jgi:hypothetical protein